MQHIRYPKIRQFKDAIKRVKSMATFIGLDEDNNPIYDHSLSMPIITFQGRVKIHGTNSGIQYDCKSGELVAQSRSQLVRDGHFGFAQWVNSNREELTKIFKKQTFREDIESIVLFGEWVGRGIQKGVGISQIEPIFILFDIVYKIKDEEELLWETIPLVESGIFHEILNFTLFSVDVDFGNPVEARDKMEKFVEQVEKECPVAKKFGVSGIGEGIVFTGTYKDQRVQFKVKGDAHKVVGSKEKIAITEEDLHSIQELVKYTVTENRVRQGIQDACGGELDKKHTGFLLKWIVKDIQSEEQDAIDTLGVTGYTKYLSDAARKIFFRIIDDDIYAIANKEVKK
jgi:hypothetical protein